MANVGYSKKVMEHFMNPRNVGVIENPDGYGKVGNPVCGDVMEIFIKVKDEKLVVMSPVNLTVCQPKKCIVRILLRMRCTRRLRIIKIKNKRSRKEVEIYGETK